MLLLLQKLCSPFRNTTHKFHAPALTKKVNPAEVLWSFTTCFLAFSCLLLIFVTSTPNGKKILSPFVASLQSASINIFGGTNEPMQSFAFVPGDAPSRFQRVDFNGLSYLSFYDTPINGDGTLDMATEAHSVFHTPDTEALFQTARQNGTKVLLTLTMTYSPDIISFLNNPQAQQELINQSVQEVRETKIDGITLAIEYQGPIDTAYKTKFSAFVKDFTDKMHASVSNSIVSIAIPDNVDSSSLYDIQALSDVTDKTMIMAYSFAVPESEDSKLVAPVYGFNGTDYLSNLSKKQNTFAASAHSDKLLMERAWYGNGKKYPLYTMDQLNAHKNDPSENTLKTPLTPVAIERLISDVPNGAKDAARRNLPYIASALEDEGILNANVLAYALATIQHETANTFEPIDEFKGRKSARRLGYEGGTDYFGRGFIQLTHLRNYQKIGQRIGVGENLVKHPELASQPKIAAKVLAAYFKDFGIAQQASVGNFIEARALINPDYNGESIATIAYGFLYALA
jgi:predicted chitinase